MLRAAAFNRILNRKFILNVNITRNITRIILIYSYILIVIIIFTTKVSPLKNRGPSDFNPGRIKVGR